MREHKYRAWHQANKAFEYWTLADFWRNGWECCSHTEPLIKCGRPEELSTTFATHAEWEEYTGLKDKNGREIYEGDIIYTQHRIISEQHPLAVAWDNDYSRFCVTHPELRGEPASLGNLNPRFWAVIGNIHENAALLDHNPGPSAE